MARRREVVAVEETLSVKERLTQKARREEPTQTKSKSDNVIVIDDRPIAEAVDRLCAASHAKKAVQGHEKAARAIVIPTVREIMLRQWVKEGRRLNNPRVQTPTGSNFILQCKDTISSGFRIPSDESGQLLSIPDYLAKFDVPKKIIEKVQAEQEFQTNIGLMVNMVKLEKDNQDLYNRLLEVILAANEGGVVTSKGKKIQFNNDEIGEILTQYTQVSVRKGFLDRAVTYAKHNSRTDDEAFENLDKLLTAVSPEWAVGQTMSMHPEEQILKMLNEEPKEEQRSAAVSEQVTADKRFTLRHEGSVVKVIRCRDQHVVGMKQCKDAAHAENTVKKWMREPASLHAFLAEQI